MQLKRRLLLILHEVLIHPFIGVIKAFSPSTHPSWTNWLHDWTVPPLSKADQKYLGDR